MKLINAMVTVGCKEHREGEVLGIVLRGNGLIPAVHTERVELQTPSGECNSFYTCKNTKCLAEPSGNRFSNIMSDEVESETNSKFVKAVYSTDLQVNV